MDHTNVHGVTHIYSLETRPWWIMLKFLPLFYSFILQNLPITPFKEPIILTLFSPKVTRCNVQLQ